MFGNQEILIINIALYVFTLLLYLRRNSMFSLGGIVLSLYTFVSIIAYFLFESPLSNFNDLKLFPFIYLYITLLLMMMPVLKFKDSIMSDLIVTRCRWLNFLSFTLIVLTIVTFFVKINEGMSISSIFNAEQLLTNYEDSHEELESMGRNGKFMIFLALHFVIIPYVIPIFIYNILIKNRKYIIGVGASILMSIFIALSDGSRVAILPYILSVPFVYLCFIKRLSYKVRKKVQRILIVCVGFVVFSFGMITFARFGDTPELLIHALENYTGQSVLYFNNYGLDANGIRYGDRVAPIVRRFMGLQTSRNYYERRMTYANMDINDSYFITFVGDFTLDFGPLSGFIILIVFALIFSRILKMRGTHYSFSQIWILFILYQWLTRGLFLWSFGEKTGNLALILGFLVYLALCHSERKYCIDTNKNFIANGK